MGRSFLGKPDFPRTAPDCGALVHKLIGLGEGDFVEGPPAIMSAQSYTPVA